MKSKQLGFSVVEFLLSLVVIAVLVGAGYKIYHKHHTSSNLASTSSNGTSTPALNKNASVSTDVQTITNTLNQQADTEASTYTQSDSSDQSAATSVNSANSNLGGAYNEANF